MSLYYNANLADPQQCKDYIVSKPILFPLLGIQWPTLKAISLQCQSAIKGHTIGQTLYLQLRIYDGEKVSWFDSLNLPEKDYVTEVTLLRFQSPSKVLCSITAFRSTITLNAYELFAYTISVAAHTADRIVINIADSERQFPTIFQL